MSILIKNMKMPKACVFCELYDGEMYWCRGAKKEIPYSSEYERADDCPLVKIPPHGDLIDRDEMFVEFVVEGQKTTRYKIGERWELNGEEIRRVIQRLPTIIEAEEGE